MQSWEDCGLSLFNLFCFNWNEEIVSFGQLKEEVEKALEIAGAIPQHDLESRVK
jgi:hypothetical protein